MVWKPIILGCSPLIAFLQVSDLSTIICYFYYAFQDHSTTPPCKNKILNTVKHVFLLQFGSIFIPSCKNNCRNYKLYRTGEIVKAHVVGLNNSYIDSPHHDLAIHICPNKIAQVGFKTTSGPILRIKHSHPNHNYNIFLKPFNYIFKYEKKQHTNNSLQLGVLEKAISYSNRFLSIILVLKW